ncbi:restriction endonuclease subunit S, partial [Lactococcus cremoris]
LQKMFPKNGAKVPELRFAGFADDWELRKSKELCTISTGKGNTQDKVDDGAYPFYVRSATIEKSDEYLYDQEAVLTVGDGVGTGKVYHYVNGKYNLHQRVYRMYDFKDVSAKYFYYYFSKNFYKRVMSMTAKTSVDSVRMEMIADMNIVFPSVKEQENIVELFSNLDNTIALHQRKLDLLKEQKKGFLQKMFV